MRKIKIITDSTCDLNDQELQKYDIEVVPLLVSFGSQTYQDRIEINTRQLYSLVDQVGELPKTAARNPGYFMNIFSKYIDEGYDVLCILISSELSSTYQSAHIASLEFDKDRIRVVDSRNLSTGIGLILLKAAKYREEGKSLLDKDPHLKAIIEAEMTMTDGNEVATMIFTSGTTGTPKGVMLTHRNFLAQLEIIPTVLPGKPNEMWLSVLPVWHSFERCIQYVVIALRSGIAYSKPLASVMLSDFATIKPQWMCGVPRLWESLVTGVYRSMKKAGGMKYAMFNFFISVGKKFAWCKSHLTGCVCQFKRRLRFFDAIVAVIPFILLLPLYALGDVLVFKKIREKLGGNFIAGISGGGALQKDVDEFYSAIGFTLIEGYGMTETAPILSLRNFKKPRKGCVGEVLPCCEIKIVAEKYGKIVSSEPLPPGKKGLILARGDQIMKGYFNRPDLTEQIIDKDGWLNTGDLGMMSYDNEIKITGRAKDTIVLLGGENIEPAVIEGELKGSDFIESVVVMGQDKKYLGALIVPSKENVMTWAAENGVPNEFYEGVLESAEVKNLIQSEIDIKINSSKEFRTCERIYKFVLLQESFKVGEELSAKQEMMRHKIAEKYAKEIERIFSE